MKIIDLFGGLITPQKGEVGIEIEVEGRRLPNRVPEFWVCHHDGSLRGEESMEYVFAKPLARKEIGKALQHLKDHWRDSDARIDRKSPRTGVHAHINVQQMELEQVVSFFSLYAIFEDLITKFCGESREGNLFCLRMRDASYLIDFMVDVVTKGNWGSLSTDRIRYAAVNMNAIPKYGSMEFRAMRGTDDVELIKLWVDMLLRIKDKALEYKEPQDILVSMSAQGPEQFLQGVMGEYAENLMCKGMDRMIKDGARRIQELAFSPIYQPKKKVQQLERSGGRRRPAVPRYNPRNVDPSEVLSAEEHLEYRTLFDLFLRGRRHDPEQTERYSQLIDTFNERRGEIWVQEEEAFDAARAIEAELQEEDEPENEAPTFQPVTATRPTLGPPPTNWTVAFNDVVAPVRRGRVTSRPTNTISFEGTSLLPTALDALIDLDLGPANPNPREIEE